MPRRLLRDGEVVADDWRALNEAQAADDSALMLTVDQWLTDRERWIARGGRLGVILAPQHKVEMLVADLARFALVVAEFPGPSEGRGYTQGRLLRERWLFSGELRATGAIGRDQIFLLARCGFNSFELPDERDRGRGCRVCNVLGRVSTVERRRPRRPSAAPLGAAPQARGCRAAVSADPAKRGPPLLASPVFRSRAPTFAAGEAPAIR